jgi:hypothetical protein
MKFSKVIIKMIVLSLILFSCNNEPGKHTTTATEKEKSSVPEKATTFNADSAYAFVKAQVGFGPRVNNTPAHEKCGNYLEKKLKEYCTDVIIQQGQVKAFNGTLLKFRNFIASYNPGTNNRIFICSHWDSRPWADHDPDKAKRRTAIDGANDGASGVGIILEIARQLSLSKPATGVDLLLLDAEDYGPPEDTKQPGEDTSDWWALGSQYWAKHPHKDNYYAKLGILLDMVGAPHATFLQE